VCEVVNVVRTLEELKEHGYWIVGLDGNSPSRFQDLPRLERVVLLIGGEGKGMRPLVAHACDFLVGIPIRGRVASLNAAAAAAIGLHEMAMRLPELTRK
jgi:23S rRNA (guanosine2251-2'-O)-methyltransferase